MVGEVPLEAELRELAAQNNGVQINETYQIQTTTPVGGFLPAPTGPQTFQDPLACIGMPMKMTLGMTAGPRVPAVEAATGSRSKFLRLLLAHP